MRSTRPCSVLLLFLLSFAVCAQGLPRPAEFYFDEDAAVTRPLAVVEGDDEAAQQRLLRMIERNVRNANLAAAQLGQIAMAAGRTDVGHMLYRQALEGTSGRAGAGPAIHWHYGWDLYRLGEHEAALGQWTQAFAGRLQNPAWVPPTLALALWRLERRAEATAWYAAAVRTWPDRWASPGDFSALLPDWSAQDRALLREVHAAWVEDAPAWP